MPEHVARLGALQPLQYALYCYAARLIYQATDGAIRFGMSGVKPHACQVLGFQHPSTPAPQRHRAAAESLRQPMRPAGYVWPRRRGGRGGGADDDMPLRSLSMLTRYHIDVADGGMGQVQEHQVHGESLPAIHPRQQSCTARTSSGASSVSGEPPTCSVIDSP
jgi:hypothetical protein